MLPGRTHVPHDCRIVADVLARIGDKWSVFAVMLLGERDYRFAELQRAMGGISKRMLSLTLKRLERDGLLVRTTFDTVPPAVSYALSPLGRSLHGAVEALGHWAVDNHLAIAAARVRFDAGAPASGVSAETAA
ncbi:winged helix-turn-helix transcriptional regulator [Massilia sp. TN1-12]|uniref:winged helix-turn-helix transcriptional regulator n=1 Tax=Massilia paldalensis TaxID=3377675 RepID=UPI00384FFB8C